MGSDVLARKIEGKITKLLHKTRGDMGYKFKKA